jgi:pimeloyl-ACP methyl ester carboxylesterase
MPLDLIVPGTGGVTLMDDEGKDLGYPARMKIGAATGGLIGKSPAELEALLSMEHRPGQEAPVETSLAPGVHIRPGRTIPAAYNQFVGSWKLFDYDWRADLRWNAAKLLNFLRTRTPASESWNLVGHSQGGLLIVLASKLLANPEEFSRLVRSVTLVAVPLAGTVNSARALIEGEYLGRSAAPVFRRIVRTWPGIYQMLPSWDAVVDPKGTPARRSLLRPATWAAHPGVRADFLARAREVQRALAHPLSQMGTGTSVSILMATNRWTDIDLIWRNGALTGDAAHEQGGDTFVPYHQTLAWLGKGLRPFVAEIGSGSRQHSMLMNDPTAVNLIRQQRSP